ncbi:MAG: hypothetical protein AAF602_06425 [Myxococcota bacterium]
MQAFRQNSARTRSGRGRRAPRRPSARARTELERTLARNPGDEAARRVYVDWLLAHGDPLGDLILTEQEWERTGETRLLPRLERLRRRCAGDLDEIPELTAVWRSGLVQRLIVRDPETAAPALASVLARPVLQALGEVEIQTPTLGPPSLPQGVIEVLARRAPASVHTVQLRHLRSPVAPPRLLARLAPLTELPSFEGVGLDLSPGHQVHLPRARLVRFRLVVRDPSFVSRLEARSWPQLQRLELIAWADHQGLGESILRALPRLRAPRLEVVVLRRFTLPHPELEALLRSRLGRRLRALDLTEATVDLRRLRRLATREPYVRRVVRR